MASRTLSEQEFAAISQKVMASAPANMDEASFNRWQGPAMAAAIAEAENLPAAVEGSWYSRLASNFGEQTNPISIAKGLYNAVSHPNDTTAAAVKDLKAEQAKAGDMYQQGRYIEAAGHGLAGMLPFIGPAAARGGEKGAEGDIAGAIGTGAGLIVAGEAPRILKAGGRAVSGPLARAGAPEALEAAGAGRIAEAMTPVTGANKTRFANMAREVAPAIAKEPGLKVWSRKGLKTGIEGKLEEAGNNLDAAADARNANMGHETQPLLDELAKRRAEQTAMPMDADRIIPTREHIPNPDVLEGRLAGQPFSFDQPGAHQLDIQPSAKVPRERPPLATEGTIAGQSFPLRKSVTAGKPREAPRPPVVEGRMAGQQFTFEPSTTDVTSPVMGQAAFEQSGAPGSYEVRPPTASAASPQGLPAAPKPPIIVTRGRPLGQAVVPGPNKPRVGVIDQATEEINQLGPQAGYDALKTIRQAYDKEAKAIYSPSFTADYMTKKGQAMGAADVAGSIRRYQGKLDPATAEEAGKFHLWKTADDVMTAVNEAESVRPSVGRKIAAATAGGVVGHGALGGLTGAALGGVIGPLIDAAMSSGYTAQIALGRYLTELADAIRKGDLAAQGRLMKMAQAEQAGRAVHREDEQQ